MMPAGHVSAASIWQALNFFIQDSGLRDTVRKQLTSVKNKNTIWPSPPTARKELGEILREMYPPPQPVIPDSDLRVAGTTLANGWKAQKSSVRALGGRINRLRLRHPTHQRTLIASQFFVDGWHLLEADWTDAQILLALHRISPITG
jgi:hypothetical protein